MKFEIGKFYQHSGGGVMHILGQVENCTGYFSPCLVGEEPGSTGFIPVSSDEEAAANWKEVPPHVYYRVWLECNPGDRRLTELAKPPPGTDWCKKYSDVVRGSDTNGGGSL